MGDRDASANGGLLSAPVEGKLHLIGMSSGGATVLAAACRAPELVASLTLVAGFIPKCCTSIDALATIPCIRLYSGAEDELGHTDNLKTLKVRLEDLGVTDSVMLRAVPGTSHDTIGDFLTLDIDEFWRDLEKFRTSEPPPKFSPKANGKAQAKTKRPGSPKPPGAPIARSEPPAELPSQRDMGMRAMDEVMQKEAAAESEPAPHTPRKGKVAPTKSVEDPRAVAKSKATSPFKPKSKTSSMGDAEGAVRKPLVAKTESAPVVHPVIKPASASKLASSDAPTKAAMKPLGTPKSAKKAGT